jgi:hypothetical protein
MLYLQYDLRKLGHRLGSKLPTDCRTNPTARKVKVAAPAVASLVEEPLRFFK